MAGELVIHEGATGWTSVATGISLTADTFAQAHATNTIAALMADNEEDYPEFDVRILVTTGTPAENDLLAIHLRPKADGTNESPAPSGAFEPHFMGSVTLDNAATTNYFTFGLSNIDKLGTFYLKSPTTLTVSMAIRMRSVNTV